MRVGIVVFPGSNCDRDCCDVVERLLGQTAVSLWYRDTALPTLDAVILPGGFSYGDALRAGAIARFAPIMQAIARFAQEGGYVLGICNGFQILVEAGLLPGAFLKNRSLRFICKPVSVRVEHHQNPYLSRYADGEVLSLPIAHGEGNYYIHPEGLAHLEAHRQILLRYCDPLGYCAQDANPNGSMGDIAALCNPAGNVMGMMPHPERASDAALSGGTDGLRLFQSLIDRGCAPDRMRS